MNNGDGKNPKSRAFDINLELEHPVETVWRALTDAEELDGEFDGISRGWSYELRCLRHYLDYHLGKPRHVGWLKQPTELLPDEARPRMLGPNGLLAEGSVTGRSEGDDYRMRSAAGENFDGRVLYHHPPNSFSGVVTGLDNSVIRYELEEGIVVLALSMWGDRENEARDFERRWRERLAVLL